MTSDENRMKISNPLRISRILRRIAQANLQVVVRTAGSGAASVKGRATHVFLDKNPKAFRIGNVSTKGAQHLAGKEKVQIEFIMMSTKVVFVSSILGVDSNSLLVALPKALISIERRKNARYSTTNDTSAFMAMSLWKPQTTSLVAPVYFAHYRGLGNYLNIADMSLGGFCAITRFPSINALVKPGLVDEKCEIVLPLHAPLEIPVEVRWVRKTKEHLNKNGEEFSIVTYRFGCEFINQTEESKISIRQFLQQLSQAGAI